MGGVCGRPGMKEKCRGCFDMKTGGRKTVGRRGLLWIYNIKINLLKPSGNFT
jgi:hypothetical protein